MTSSINPAKPTTVTPRISDVRANFAAAKAEIEALQAALTLLAPLVNAHLTGIPTAPTAAPTTNTVQLATTEFVQAATATATASHYEQVVTGSASSDVYYQDDDTLPDFLLTDDGDLIYNEENN